jgi:uncharacterized protein (DUF1015 family)
MAEIRPFAALRYDPARVSWPAVLTQPYDKITPEMQQRYYALDPHNLVRIEKGLPAESDSPHDNVYTRAAAALREGRASGILVRDPAPAIYAYSQRFTLPGQRSPRARHAFIALGRLEDYSAGVVHRHELTHSGPRADRLELLRATRVQTGQLFMLYDDPERRLDSLLAPVRAAPPACSLEDEFGVRHSLWPISDREAVARIAAAMAGKKLVIADGHHRYETALAFRDECRAASLGADADAPHEFAMMTFVNSRDAGLVILPTHRIVAGLPAFDLPRFRSALARAFDWYAYPFSDAEAREEAFAEFRRDLAARGRESHAIGLYAGDGAYYLFLLRADAALASLLADVPAAQRSLDVVLLHRLMLEQALGISPDAVLREQHVRYERDAAAAVAEVDRCAGQAAFLLNPIGVETVMRLALAGEVLPQKSTDFYPKMLSGIAIYALEP